MLVLVGLVPTATAAAQVNVTIGYLRMSGADLTDTLASLFATVKKANAAGNLPDGYQYVLDVYTVRCATDAECIAIAGDWTSSAKNVSLTHPNPVINRFFSNMPTFAGIIRPCPWISGLVIDVAKVHGGVPVFDPVTVRVKDFQQATGGVAAQDGTYKENIINFKQLIRTDIAHVFTYMQHSAGCAVSGIFYDDFDQMASHVVWTQQLFVSGGLKFPPALNIRNATDDRIRKFMMHEDPQRQCFLCLMHSLDFRRVVEAGAKDLAFTPEENRFYGPSLIGADSFTLANTTNSYPYSHTNFARWFPSVGENQIQAVVAVDSAFNAWRPYITDAERAVFEVDGGQAVPDKAEDFTLGGYLVASYVTRVIGATIGRVGVRAMEQMVADIKANATLAGVSVPMSSIPWRAIMNTVYSGSQLVDNFDFQGLTRVCPTQPSQQSLCFCNTVTKTSYLFTVGGTSPDAVTLPTTTMDPTVIPGRVKLVWDNEAAGERGISSVAFSDKCGFEASSWSYPITVLYLYPSTERLAAISPNANTYGMTLTEIDDAYNLTVTVLQRYIHEINYATTAPARAFRSAGVPSTMPKKFSIVNGSMPTTVPLSTSSVLVRELANIESIVEAYIGSYNPFVVLGALASGSITHSSVLTLFPSLTHIQTEDPPLAPHGIPWGEDNTTRPVTYQWDWQVINLRPSLADYIHSLACYFSDRNARYNNAQPKGAAKVGYYTTFHAIATNSQEAGLIAKSFATFGYDVHVSDVVVSQDPALWTTLVTQWLTEAKPAGSSARHHPFVIAATTFNPYRCMHAAFKVAVEKEAGTFALASSEETFRSARIYYPIGQYAPTVVGGVTAKPFVETENDVIFASSMTEWWTEAALEGVLPDLVVHAHNPRYHMTMSAIQVLQQLSTSVSTDFTTSAAALLYKAQTISTSRATYGPFYNESCTEEEVKANSRDRKCQCTKGPRTLYVHSAKNKQDSVPSTRTGRYTYTMTTCGVVYSPYVPPADLLLASNSLSTGAIAGVAVGCSLFGLLVLCTLVFLLCCSGRSHRYAPKDASHPFSIVFTDIQSSTALWAGAPSAMRDAVEQHHALMRSIISSHRGYEVKTIGDSFMVAFSSPSDATRFGLEVQTAFNSAQWSSEIEAIYRELMEEMRNEYLSNSDGEAFQSAQSVNVAGVSGMIMGHFHPEGHLPLSQVLDLSGTGGIKEISNSTSESPRIVVMMPPAIEPATPMPPPAESSHTNIPNNHSIYSKVGGTGTDEKSAILKSFADNDSQDLWRGLRVRVGIHSGLGEVRRDPVSGGYDYYGTVVNTAARVEGVGHGGQVLITDDAYHLLEDNFSAKHSVVMLPLGPQPLRGLDESIKLYQLLPQALAGRHFPPLRLHIEKDTDEITDTTATETSATASEIEQPEELATRIASNKQYQSVSPEMLSIFYHFVTTLFSPGTDKFRKLTSSTLAQMWGMQDTKVHGDKGRMRAMMLLLAKVTKAFNKTRVGRQQQKHMTEGDSMIKTFRFDQSLSNRSPHKGPSNSARSANGRTPGSTSFSPNMMASNVSTSGQNLAGQNTLATPNFDLMSSVNTVEMSLGRARNSFSMANSQLLPARLPSQLVEANEGPTESSTKKTN